MARLIHHYCGDRNEVLARTVCGASIVSLMVSEFTEEWAAVTCELCQRHRPVGAVTDPTVGMKFDGGKPRWFRWFSLMPWNELRDVGAVLVKGAEKYSRDNWRHVKGGEERYFDAMMRHLEARFVRGELLDQDDGLSHLSHACCDLLFLMWIDKQPADHVTRAQ
jgi:hypothetical protein